MAFITSRRLKVFYLNIVKQSGDPESISRGIAIGFFTGFFIPIGGQMIIAVALAFIFKARKIPALACTWITNPWTIPFIYPFQCFLGAKVIGGHLSFATINELIGSFITHPNFEALRSLNKELIIPFFIGGTILGVISAFISYFTSYGMITSHSKRVEVKLAKRMARLEKRNAAKKKAHSKD